uniref:Uncharacterized protein n=1 Tax=Tetraselmis sp. GSL018 TaxID=582737 RepID=A0A061S9F3_9CHLO|eukprot:CAMPEP_0177589936 /NCGR_PEP_ID=MMETSP0419_2-20121207/7104_1 /TAXON_ID=582737 /ORGANISM="Tetraselmis sp., Strain GSL018" /LENGTH=981 /DNA_ID=CAMNT_0019080393 /DNA_START=574 /DNA_END=3519 /DNA_ORIENTATION=-
MNQQGFCAPSSSGELTCKGARPGCSWVARLPIDVLHNIFSRLDRSAGALFRETCKDARQALPAPTHPGLPAVYDLLERWTSRSCSSLPAGKGDDVIPGPNACAAMEACPSLWRHFLSTGMCTVDQCACAAARDCCLRGLDTEETWRVLQEIAPAGDDAATAEFFTAALRGCGEDAARTVVEKLVQENSGGWVPSGRGAQWPLEAAVRAGHSAIVCERYMTAEVESPESARAILELMCREADHLPGDVATFAARRVCYLSSSMREPEKLADWAGLAGAELRAGSAVLCMRLLHPRHFGNLAMLLVEGAAAAPPPSATDAEEQPPAIPQRLPMEQVQVREGAGAAPGRPVAPGRAAEPPAGRGQEGFPIMDIFDALAGEDEDAGFLMGAANLRGALRQAWEALGDPLAEPPGPQRDIPGAERRAAGGPDPRHGAEAPPAGDRAAAWLRPRLPPEPAGPGEPRPAAAWRRAGGGPAAAAAAAAPWVLRGRVRREGLRLGRDGGEAPARWDAAEEADRRAAGGGLVYDRAGGRPVAGALRDPRHRQWAAERAAAPQEGPLRPADALEAERLERVLIRRWGHPEDEAPPREALRIRRRNVARARLRDAFRAAGDGEGDIGAWMLADEEAEEEAWPGRPARARPGAGADGLGDGQQRPWLGEPMEVGLAPRDRAREAPAAGEGRQQAPAAHACISGLLQLIPKIRLLRIGLLRDANFAVPPSRHPGTWALTAALAAGRGETAAWLVADMARSSGMEARRVLLGSLLKLLGKDDKELSSDCAPALEDMWQGAVQLLWDLPESCPQLIVQLRLLDEGPACFAPNRAMEWVAGHFQDPGALAPAVCPHLGASPGSAIRVYQHLHTEAVLAAAMAEQAEGAARRGKLAEAECCALLKALANGDWRIAVGIAEIWRTDRSRDRQAGRGSALDAGTKALLAVPVGKWAGVMSSVEGRNKDVVADWVGREFGLALRPEDLHASEAMNADPPMMG